MELPKKLEGGYELCEDEGCPNHGTVHYCKSIKQEDSSMKFRKKPIVVEAWQLLEQNLPTIPDWIDINGFAGEDLYIDTLEGVVCASTGDWIIKGIKGEVYPCKPDIFEATYELMHTDPLYEKAIHETQTEKLKRLHLLVVNFFIRSLKDPNETKESILAKWGEMLMESRREST